MLSYKHKILVTGASGFLATHIIKELLEKGYYVVGILRSPQKFLLPFHPNLELKIGDIIDLEFLEEAMWGCSYVIHAAATTSQKHLSYAPYFISNVEGTSNVVNAALKNRIKRIVYVSTANTIGFGSAIYEGTEDAPMEKPFTKSWYAISKLKGEEIVRSVGQRMETIIVHPTFMLGAYDAGPSSGVIILKGYRRKLLLCPPGGKNFVHVKDVAKGIIKAMENGQHGSSYLLSGQNMRYKDFFKLMAQTTNTQSILVPLPKWIVLVLGAVCSILRMVGIPLSLSLNNAKILCLQPNYSNLKASQELQITFSPIVCAINEAVDWFIAHEMIQSK